MALVSNQPLREAFERSDLSFSELARRLGHWQNGNGRNSGERVPDVCPVTRALGLRPDPKKRLCGKDYPPKLRERMREPTALRYAKALNLDPVDIGL